MLLRRIALRLRQHDWVAFAIELVLVFAGVFAGIQVSNWNDARRERALERTYLVRIADDIRSDVAEMDEIVRVSTLRMSLLNRLLRDATGTGLPTGFDSARGRVAIEPVPTLAEDDPNDPGFALFILSTLDGNRSAYETLINAGGIGIMRDASTLRRIQDYYAAVDKAVHFEVGLEQNRDKLIDALRRIGVSPVSGPTREDRAREFASNAELLATAQNYWLYTNRHVKLTRELQHQAGTLADSIAAPRTPEATR